MVFGLCPAGTQIYNFTKTSFKLLRGCILQKYGSQSLSRLFGTIPDFNHREVVAILFFLEMNPLGELRTILHWYLYLQKIISPKTTHKAAKISAKRKSHKKPSNVKLFLSNVKSIRYVLTIIAYKVRFKTCWKSLIKVLPRK